MKNRIDVFGRTVAFRRNRPSQYASSLPSEKAPPVKPSMRVRYSPRTCSHGASWPSTPSGAGQLAPWLQVRGEYRTRIEGFTGGAFTDGNDDAYWLGRFRLNATARPNTSMRFFIQTQDARAFDRTTGGL